MATQVDIAKIKVRRGLDSERQQVILDNGELGFTTDTQRLFVGDGTTLGGIAVSSRYIGSFANVNDVTNAQQGDIAIINNVTYLFLGGDQNDINDYFNIATVGVDNVTIEYNGFNQLQVKSITNFIAGSVDGSQGMKITPSNQYATKVDSTSVVYNGSGAITVGTITGTQHGNQSGGPLHSVATPSVAGFMSATDKAKLNNSPDWTVTPLSNSQTQNIITSINSYGLDAITNVSAPNTVKINTGNTTTVSVSGSYLLNQQNGYNETLQPGAITYSSITSSKISNVGQLPCWQFDTTGMDLTDRGFILIGGDGRQYGFYNNVTNSFYQTPNVTWVDVGASDQPSLMAAISSVESSGVYSYRLFDVYTDTANLFWVKGLYPNYSTYYNDINGGTSISITPLTNGKQSAALTRKLICNTTVSTSFPVSGFKTKNVIQVDSSITGAAIDIANSNKYITVYDSNYTKHVFWFNNSITPQSPPAVNNNVYYPGTITQIHKIDYTTASSSNTIFDLVTAALDNAGFDVLDKTSGTIQFQTGIAGYSLDIFTNYDASVINSVTLGGDYLTTQTAGNGVPNVSTMSEILMDNITSIGSPGIVDVKLPGVPAISYTVDSGSRNSVALIKY